MSEGPAIQLMNLLSFITYGKADNLNGTARSLYRKMERLGRKVRVEKKDIETDILKAYLRADELSKKVNGQATANDGASTQFPLPLEQTIGAVEYAK